MLAQLKRFLQRHWREPLALEGSALDSRDALLAHRSIVQAKPLLRRVYERWYGDYARALAQTAPIASLPAVEIGSGIGLVRDYLPEILRTDVVPQPFVDQVVSADKLPWPERGIRALFMMDVLHHLPDPRAFFTEAQRVLAIGGRIVIVEPTNSWLGRLLWKNLHPSERFDPAVEKWESSLAGRLSDANMAIPWILFCRDRPQFEREFPGLAIRGVRPHTMLAYALTGGLSFRPLMPDWLGRWWIALERPLSQWFPFLATMMTIELEKVDVSAADQGSRQSGTERTASKVTSMH